MNDPTWLEDFKTYVKARCKGKLMIAKLNAGWLSYITGYINADGTYGMFLKVSYSSVGPVTQEFCVVNGIWSALKTL